MFGISNSNRSVDISWNAILKIILAFFGVYVVYILKDIILWVFFAMLLSVLFQPAIDFIQKFRVSRVASVLLVYFSLFILIGLLLYSLVPIFQIEFNEFSTNFPQYLNQISPLLSGIGINNLQDISSVSTALQSWFADVSSKNILGSIASVFGGIFLTITIFTIAIFFSLEDRGIEKFLISLLPKKYESFVADIWKKTQIKVSGWFAARLLGMLALGIMVAIACALLGIKYAILFGIIAGIADIIPFIGSFFAGSLMVLFALTISWQQAIAILVAFIIAQQIQNNILTPILTKKFIEFPPVLVIISLLVGQQLWGFWGLIFAIPIFAIFYDFTRDFLSKNKS